ncbi:uncharacterized protein BP01DRAFT_360532 [Aspergillus saccharolyticus JOP 1030-1]|uniref:Uncharacterized protein n=1 Tax=Aspergillus saccharolyticus JOP 1030-1 TaxID=1450539 RepID=A0A318ZMI8_9EURO|nr:hypothetical protein BP01DRAFT_360532 [Aspergillus saccharolyticus JOP 1030-1]PYH41398.1 hypothetical protein BP01DRAFT_360532 [Aspergillus saccharolyticus JOP 1030-1]
MYTSALLFALSLTAQAAPVFQSQANDTMARRHELPYKVVNVAGTPAPTVETVTATPSPPVTVTVTEYPSSTPALGPFFSSWGVGPQVTGTPLSEPPVAARGLNSTENHHRRHEHAAETNTTVTEAPASQVAPAMIKRSNEAVSHAFTQHNATENEHHAEHDGDKALIGAALTHIAGSANETQPARMDVAPEHAATLTDAKHIPHSTNDTVESRLVLAAEQSGATKRAVNTTDPAAKHFIRSSNSTSVHARNVTEGDY